MKTIAIFCPLVFWAAYFAHSQNVDLPGDPVSPQNHTSTVRGAAQMPCNAPGDGVTDATGAVQGCIDRGGTLRETNPYLNGATVLATGGVCIYLSPGKYLITRPLFYNSGSCITGTGDGTEFLFSPGSGQANFLEPNPEKSAWSHLHDTVRLSNFLVVARNRNAQDGFHFDNSERIFMENVNVIGFPRYNISITQSADTESGSYYNMLINVRSLDGGLANLYIDTPANSTQIIGGVYRDSPNAPFKKFNVITKAQATSMFGPSLEGNVKSAQVDAEGPTSIYGCYNEVPAGGHAPVVLADMGFQAGETGGVAVNNCLLGGGIALKGWDIAHSDELQTSIRAPNRLDTGNPKWQDLIENGSFEHGTYKWGQLNGRHQGTITAGTAETYNSKYSLELQSNGAGNNSAYTTIPGGMLTSYLGRRLYFTFLIHTDKNKQSIQLGNYGAGNTSSKLISRPLADLGNGWKLWVIDYPVLRAQDLTIYLNQASAVPGATVYLGAVNAYLDGYELSPPNRERTEKYDCVAPPATGIWRIGDICWNSNPHGPSPIGYWINVEVGRPGKWVAK